MRKLNMNIVSGLFFVMLSFLAINSHSQSQFGFNTTSVHTSAVMEMTSTTKGLLIPRMTTAQRDAISSPANGLLVFDTDLDRLYFYDAAWLQISGAWRDTANRVVTISDSVGIGVTTPFDRLHVSGNIRANIYYDANNSTYYLDPGSATSGRLEGNLQIGFGSASDDDYLYFDQNGQSIKWDNTGDEFDFSNNINTTGITITTSPTDGYVLTSDATGIGTWQARTFSTATNVTSNSGGTLATDDFVFGSSQLDDDGDVNHDFRFFFDKSTGAFRAGAVTTTEWDAVNSGLYSVAFGSNTIASGNVSTALGDGTEASGDRAFAAGQFTTASGSNSIAIGFQNNATATSSVALGNNNTASAQRSFAIGTLNTASGDYSTVIGYLSKVDTSYCLALGRKARTNKKIGSIVIADGYNGYLDADTDYQLMIRASGGTKIYSNTALSAGVSLASGGGSWSSISDKNKKENFIVEDPELVLQKIANMEINSWNYKSQDDSIRHIGPFAQDFRAAFGLGEDDVTINTVDIDGINMIAIQALEKRTNELANMQSRVTELELLVHQLMNERANN
ncbi:MAG: tail fiber domain-containing protein [Bacteroidetes bacterium]|nr:tail fiber domain-containing protein [Bacteroidota bacterium]